MSSQTHAMTQIATDIADAAGTNAGVLISGEPGCGKELVARLIHQRSRRASAPFITAEHTDPTDSALEPARDGTAPSGTVFLGGVDKLSPRIQLLLFDLIGPRTPDVRVIVSTSRDLYADVVAGEFREDLYYRLNVVHVVVPPASIVRIEDLPPGFASGA